MKKNEYAPYALIVYIILIIIYSMLMSCSPNLYVGARYSSCPTNDKTFFYKRAGVKPTKQFLMWN